jgi:hypothetical protein
MKKILLFITLFTTILLSSCTTQSYVSNFSKFVNRTDDQCKDYSFKKWKRNIKQFKNYSVTQFYKRKADLTPSQYREVLLLDARYVTIVGSEGVFKVVGIVKDIKTMGPEVLNDLLNTYLKQTKKKK